MLFQLLQAIPLATQFLMLVIECNIFVAMGRER